MNTPRQQVSLIYLSVLGGITYFIAGQLGLALTTGPSNISPIWPPAGIALGLVLIYGYRAIPGLFLGALAIHLHAFHTPEALGQSLLTGNLTSIGSVLQAVAAKALADRWVSRPFTLLADKDILRFVALSTLACTIAASIGTLSLYLTHAIALDVLPVVWGTWWIGDTIGVIIVTPMVLALLGKPAQQWRSRRITLVLPLLGTLLFSIIATWYANQLNEQRILKNFAAQAQIFIHQIEDSAVSVLHFLHLNKHLVESAQQLDQQDFNLLTKRQTDLPLSGLYWLESTPQGWRVKQSAFVDPSHCLNRRVPPFIPASRFRMAEALPLVLAQKGTCEGLFLYLPVKTQAMGSSAIAAVIDPTHLIQSMNRQILLPADTELDIHLQAASPRPHDQPPQARMDAQHRISTQARFRLGDQDWVITLTVPASYHNQQQGWGIWYVLLGGLLFSSLLSIGLLMLTGRNSQIARTVEHRTEELTEQIAERQQGEKLLALQNTVLGAIARDTPLADCLNLITEQFEELSPAGAMATVMIVNPEKQVLELRAGPSLTQEVAEALVIFPIGENEGSCGTAVHRGEMVVCPDIACNIEWQKYRNFAKQHGLGACWSMPIKSRTGKVLGSFALTHPEARKPGEQNVQHLTTAATLCAMAIEQDNVNAALRRLSLVVEQAPSGVLMANLEGRVIYANERASDIFGKSLDDIRNTTLSALFTADLSSESFGEVWSQLLAGKESRESLRLTHPDGTEIWTQCYFAPVSHHSKNTEHLVAIIDDVSDLQKSSQQLAYQASHDALTELFNRAEFDRRLAQMVGNARANAETHSLCFIDLDRFKSINDTEGHNAGDALLRQLSLLMREQVRRGDILARFGGDEFAILFEHCDLAKATENTETLRQKITEYPFVWNGRSYHIGLSAGLVEITTNSPEPQELLRQVDAACYSAKEQGRNRIQVYQGGPTDIAQRDSDVYWASQLREALTNNQLVLFQQRIQAFEPETPASIEILVRMRDDKGDLVPPGRFLPAAEKYGVMPELDAWVLQNVLRHFTKHPEQLAKLNYCAINLSGQSLTAEFAARIERWLAQHPAVAERLCLEITETAAIANLNQAQNFIHKLAEKGVRFALDDFGSGLSSFAYLKNLPVDILKIDGQFVRDINEDPIDYAMVKAINAVGKVMGKYTVAEFVENQATVDDLRHIGVDALQGYGIHRPEPLTND